MNFYHHSFLAIITAFFTLHLHAQESQSPADSVAMHFLMEEITVTEQAEKTAIKGTFSGKVVITPASISKIPSLLGNPDLLKLLELTPSVQNPGDVNSNIYVRGGDAGQNLLLYNSVPLYTPGHLLGFFPLFNPDHVSSLELTKTGANARYGGRLSSVIDVQSKQTLPEKTSITGNAGLLASQATLAVPVGKKFGLYLSGRKSYIELLVQPLLNSSLDRNSKDESDNTGYRFYDTNLTLIGDVSPKNRIVIDAFLGKDKLNISESDLLLNGLIDWKNDALSLQWDTKIKENPFAQQIYSSRYKNNLLIKQAEMDIEMESGIEDAGYKNKYIFSAGNIPFEAGMQYSFHRIKPQSFHIANDELQYNTGESTVQKAHDAALYLSSNIELLSALNMEAGVRYNFFLCNKTFQSIDPRLALYYQLKEDRIVLRASYSRQHQYISLLTPSAVGIPTNFWITASDDVLPQSGNEFSTGYSQSFLNDDFDVSAEIYYRNMNNVTEYLQNFINGQENSYANDIFYGKGRSYGLEMILKKRRGKLTGWISYALGRSERNFDDINNGRTFPAQFDRRHNLSVVASYVFNRKWDVSAVYIYSTGNAYTLPSSWYFINNTPVKEYADYNAARMPNYNRADLSVNYWFKKDNGINLSFYNLFMFDNPIYIFLNVEQDKDSEDLRIRVRQKTLYTIIPSLSWRFKF